MPTALPTDERDPVLQQRILSALVLGPVALIAVYVGSPLFDAMVALSAAIMTWEWDRICRGHFSRTGRVTAIAVAVAALLGAQFPMAALAVVWFGMLGAALFSRSGWLAMGALYIGVPVIALTWLREAAGLTTLLWLLAIVWATDIGAYAAGRTIGGPKLAPRISPNKTWAGLIGGVTTAVVAGGLVAWIAGEGEGPLVGVFAALLAASSQMGDLFESSVKRRFKVKDSSNIIPGHGGVLDRVDGLIAAAPILAFAVVALGGGLDTW
jgi:phosphatidate cytidylyltransferase